MSEPPTYRKFEIIIPFDGGLPTHYEAEKFLTECERVMQITYDVSTAEIERHNLINEEYAAIRRASAEQASLAKAKRRETYEALKAEFEPDSMANACAPSPSERT
jgi:hypothetical protein